MTVSTLGALHMSTISSTEATPSTQAAPEPDQPASEQRAPVVAPVSTPLRMSGELAGRLLSSSRWLQ